MTSTPAMPEYHGSLVAFEGPADVISTQLRLLPTSPQILILPGIQNYLPSELIDGAFEPATYVRRLHDAAATRTAAATSFLRDATPDSKRLVFLHGGTPFAYALCIDAFTKHETAGDRRRAETLFQELVASGVPGLSTPCKPRQRNKRGLVLDECALFQAQFQDPITRAMRAADALDEQTAALQPDPDLSLRKPRPRSMSLPVYGYVDHLGDSAPFYVFGANAKEEVEDEAIEDEGIQGRSFFLQSPRLDACFFDDQDELEPLEPPRSLSIAPRSPSCTGEAYRSRYNSVVVGDGQSVLEAGDVVFGEASLVRMSKEMPPRNLKRVKSLDTGTARRGSCRDLPLRLAPTGPGEDALENLRRFSCVDPTHERLPISPVSPRFSVYGSPKTVFVKPARLARKDSVRPARASYVDKGTDAKGDTAAEEAFQSVLPFSEDMVLYFKDESSDPLLESLIESFRTGTYPPPPSSRNARRASAMEHLVGATHRQSTPPRSEEDSSSVTEFMEAITKSISLNDDYDPFAYDKQPTWAAPAKTTASISPTITPPTPAQTPPPPPVTTANQEGKITDFDTSGCHTAVALQNALRSVLEKRFPAENGGFYQFSLQHLPELGRLWKPIFKDDAGSQCEVGRSVDQIIAVGAQAGVRKEFVASVSRRLEMLGSDPSGTLRSGRLDFRYLLVNAMQSFTAQPLAKQTENPFSSPYLLATLIIPHLETYLAAHSETGLLLLEYPPDHLSTVLAIQRLVGVDLMKVAQIVDSGPMPFAHIRGSPIHFGHLSPPSGSPNLSSTCHADSLPFTHANFLLTSSATEDEIEDFIDTFSKILVEISPLYVPRPKSEAPSSPSKNTFGSNKTFSTVPISIPAPPWRHSSLPRSPPQASQHSSIPRSPPSPARSDRSQLTGETRGNTPPSSSQAHFVVSSRKDASPRSGAVSREHRPTYEHQRQASVQTYDGAEFEDLGVELDLEEKRLMPIFMGNDKRVSSQKALKFLGLA